MITIPLLDVWEELDFTKQNKTKQKKTISLSDNIGNNCRRKQVKRIEGRKNEKKWKMERREEVREGISSQKGKGRKGMDTHIAIRY